MRVISGQARGHKLRTPEGRSTRPTTDRIKESLFNILAPDLLDCEFLDLYSGSGGIGIEALSRGAKKAVFVDGAYECKTIIEENLKSTKLFDKAEVYKQDVPTALYTLGKKGKSFDIIFMDPPYESGLVEPTLKAIIEGNLLKKEGFIVVEHGSKDIVKDIKGLSIIKEKDYKTTVMTFLILEELTC